jgi:5-hydroxyisourate hydrolase
MSAITTHVLDTSRGQPVHGMAVVLERSAGHGTWREVGGGRTDADGRARNLVPEGEVLTPGIYRLVFDTERYFQAQGMLAFYPEIVIVFATRVDEHDYHVPLLVSPFGYTTYRGS